MKELSIEEKAKRYDEAIEKGKQIQNTPYTAHWDIMKEVAEHLLPELKESDDERIGKEIVNFINHKKAMGSITPEESKRTGSWIAWLEKQGEQKSMKTCAEYYNQNNELKMPELSEFQDKLADILMYREYNGPDETEDDIAKGRLEYELAAIRLSEELLPLAQKEQKPAGWSEKLIADVFEMVGLAKIVREQENDALTRALQSAIIELAKYSVVPQIRQEWSEEDEKIINKISIAIANQYSCDTAIKIENWLKFLRPQNRWKPSKEQMNTLEQWLKDNQYKGDARYCYSIFESLYQDLKKLKG